MSHWLIRLVKEERGASAIEYGLIIAMITLAMIGALGTVAQTTISMWDEVSERVSTA